MLFMPTVDDPGMMRRVSFLVRFTVVTFVSAGVAAVVLALTLTASHRRSIENDATIAALGRIDARVAAPLARYARGGPAAAMRSALDAARAEASLDPFVSALRVYDAAGRPLSGNGDPHDDDAVRRAATAEGFVRLTRGHTQTIFQPYAAGDRTFVLAIDFARAQMDAQFASESWTVVPVTAGAVALIFVALVTLAAGASRELERRRREAQTTFIQTLVTLAETVDLRDPYTAGHSQRVAEYSRCLACELGLDAETVDHVEQGALLHDIGKLGVPDAVLFKGGPLDRTERALIERHPVIGARLIAHVPCAEHVTPCVLHHHERFDGSGYPDRLRGEEIPLGARIIAVADAFDAMTTDRPYRAGLSTTDALERLVAGSARQFDARCVAAFAKLVAAGTIVPPQQRGTVRFAQRAVFELEELATA
jgi:putative nucleotidyltransferase with HDIG domain